MPSLAASLCAPVKAATSRAAIHSRWVIQAGIAANLPRAKNGPIGNR